MRQGSHIQKASAGWIPKATRVICAAPPGAGARAAASTSAAEVAEASSSAGATGLSPGEFRAARSGSRSRSRPSAAPLAMAVAKQSAGPTWEVRPPTPPICGYIERRSSDHVAGSYAPWIRAGVQALTVRMAVPGVPSPRASPPYDARRRPYFGIPSTPRSDAPGLLAVKALPCVPSASTIAAIEPS